MLKIIMTILSAGIPGMLTFWLLSTFGILNYSKNDMFEKTSSLAFFSFLNMGLGIALYDFISRKGIIYIYNKGQFPKIMSMGTNVPAYINLGMCTLFITIVLSIVAYPVIFKIFMIIYNWIIRFLKLPSRSTNSVLWNALNKYSDINATIYIFDFDDRFIESGTVKRISDYDEESLIALQDHTGHTKTKIKYEDVLEEYNSQYDRIEKLMEETKNDDWKKTEKEPEIVIDFVNKLKFIIIY